MLGMDAATGQPLAGLDHLTQSIRVILATPIGSRVMRRDFGSRLPRLVDAPANAATLVEVTMATAEALRRWEPRLRLRRVALAAGADGVGGIEIEGDYLPDGKPLSLLFRRDEIGGRR